MRTEYTHLCGVCHEEHVQPAFRTAVPGLLVARGWYVHNPDEADDWFIVHHPTGLAIPSLFDDPETVQAAARDIGPMADWTAVDPDCDSTEVLSALRALGGRRPMPSAAGQRIRRNGVDL